MALATLTLQQLQFPHNAELADYGHLFFREGLSGERPEDRLLPKDARWNFSVRGGVLSRDNRIPSGAPLRGESGRAVGVRYDQKNRCLVIPAGSTADLSCYFNMLSTAKWTDLTYARDFKLVLDIEGGARIDVISYQLDDFETVGQVEEFRQRMRDGVKDGGVDVPGVVSVHCACANRGLVSVPVENATATLTGFAIAAETETRLFGGSWTAQVDECHLRPVELCIATTTFKKEEFITRNVQAMKDLAASDFEFGAHFQMIVVDNGRTLDPSDFEDDHVRVFGNINAGGAGGFARGMIEALRLEKRPTHLLIMDDDVLILPESIKRTFTLLRTLRPEFQDRFISGAMLCLESMDLQYEDIGFIQRAGFFASKKDVHFLRTVIDCAANEVAWPDFGHEYAAWWFCCVPMERVSEDSLPIPVFIRGDDVEFSIRNNAEMITMNGICVWHVGFTQKFSASLEYYQVIRNGFILGSFHERCDDVDFLGNWNRLVTLLINELAYDYADLVLDALEDYLKGPSILEEPNGIDIIKEKGRKNEALVPLAEVWKGDADFDEVFKAPNVWTPGYLMRRELGLRSFNGQQALQSLVTDETGFAPYDWEHFRDAVYMKKRVVSLCPNDLTATVRERDPERFAQVIERKQRLTAQFKAQNESVKAEYRSAHPRLTSLGFWKGYLKLEDR